MTSFLKFLCVLAFAALAAADNGDDVVCPEHQTTVFRKPYKGDCTKYWECYQGAKYVQTCPPGLEFNAPLMQCDIPEIAKCDHSHDTTSAPHPPTKAPISTTTGSFKPDPMCPYPSNEIVYFIYPEDCTKFYECYQGHKYVKQCPAGLYWNQPISQCDYPENVKCDPKKL